MINNDTGNATTQKMYEIATEPVFVDRSEDNQTEISWNISSEEEIPLPPPLESVKEENQLLPENIDKSSDESEMVNEDDSIEQEEPEKKKKKNRISEKNRIAQLTRELRQAQSVAHDVLTRNQYLESKISQKEKEAFTNQENYLAAQKERIKKYLTDAIEVGDSEKIVEAQDLLAQYNLDLLLIKKQNTSENQIQNPQQNYYQEQQNIPYAESGKKWIEQNSWADPNSHDFDQEMYEDADNYSIRLARKYKLEGRGSEVGTEDFFNEITDYIKNSYDIVDTNHLPSKPTLPIRNRIQMKTDQSPPVGTVNRQGIQGTENQRKSDNIVLTPEQKEIAHSLRGFVSDPKTGLKITDNKTLEEIYKRNLMRGN